MGIQFIHRAALLGVMAAVAAPVGQSLHAQAVVRGVLYDDATGTPVRGTVMLVDPSTDAAIVHVSTDSLGNFSLQTGRGVFQLAAVRPGYSSVLSAPIPLENGERITIRVPIAEQGDPQHRIGVTEHIRPSEARDAKRAAADPTGFASRRVSGTGLQYDRKQLEKSTYHTLGEFLQNVPGLKVGDPNSTGSMMMSRTASMQMAGAMAGSLASCSIGWFVDGHRMDMPGRTDGVTDGLGGIPLDAIEAVEVFRGLSEMPSEFASPELRCGAIAIWTRRG